MRDIFISKYNYPISNTNVVGNTLNSIFLKKNLWKEIDINTTGEFSILCLGAFYPHKNFNIIRKVIDTLINQYNFSNFRFYISVEKKNLDFPAKYNKHINYLGRVDLNKIPSLYQKVDVLFMPSLLECFSTTFLEAMFMKVPIVCSELGFAKDICKQGALYYDPTNHVEAAKLLFKLSNNQTLINNLTSLGVENFKRFGTSLKRTQKYLEILNNLNS